jgi:hypothetical protein
LVNFVINTSLDDWLRRAEGPTGVSGEDVETSGGRHQVSHSRGPKSRPICNALTPAPRTSLPPLSVIEVAETWQLASGNFTLVL